MYESGILAPTSNWQYRILVFLNIFGVLCVASRLLSPGPVFTEGYYLWSLALVAMYMFAHRQYSLRNYFPVTTLFQLLLKIQMYMEWMYNCMINYLLKQQLKVKKKLKPFVFMCFVLIITQVYISIITVYQNLIHPDITTLQSMHIIIVGFGLLLSGWEASSCTVFDSLTIVVIPEYAILNMTLMNIAVAEKMKVAAYHSRNGDQDACERIALEIEDLERITEKRVIRDNYGKLMNHMSVTQFVQVGITVVYCIFLAFNFENLSMENVIQNIFFIIILSSLSFQQLLAMGSVEAHYSKTTKG